MSVLRRIKFWWWKVRNKRRLRHLAETAAGIAQAAGLSGVQVLGALLENASRRERERLMQQMIDSVVAVQDQMPMPEEGWGRFVRDMEHTNEKHGMNLRIRK
ncbi:MAG: hypothetical protein KAJ01_10435 [Candidatus Hydrogenedentes bacterium]|nr:hypothetical protein [Candidatus Hydrogenedentota bacterium]